MKNVKTFKQLLWFVTKPVFPIFRRLFVDMGFVRPPTSGKHLFHLGYINKNITKSDLKKLLKKRGYFPQPMAFDDPMQILSLRKLDDRAPDFQYHLRFYADGELRGHYEKTPEDHPIDHLREIGFEDRKEFFLKSLKGLVSETQTISTSELLTPEKPNHIKIPLYHVASPKEEINANL